MKKLIYCVATVLISLTGFAQDADLFRKDGHKSELVSVSISPDNKYIISVERDTLAIIWDITTGQQIRTIKNVESAAFRDNASIYLAMNDKTFRLVDLLGQKISEFGSKGAKYQISQYQYRGIPKLFYPETGLYLFGDDVFDMDKGYQRRLEFKVSGNEGYSPLTRQLAVADNKNGKISLVDVVSGKLTGIVQTNNLKEENMKLTYSPNGKKLLVTMETTFQVIDIASRKIQQTIKRNATWNSQEGVFSPGGETLALCDEINRVERLTVLDVESGNTLFIRNFKEFMFPVKMEFSPDGGHLAFWVQEYEDKESLYLLDAKKGTTNWRYNSDDLSTVIFGSSMLFSADGQKLLFGNSKNLLLLNASTGLKEKSFASTSQGKINQLYFLQDNSRMVSYTHDYIFSWNLQTGEMDRTLFSKEKKGDHILEEYTPVADGKKYFTLQADNLIEMDTAGKKTFQFTSIKKLQQRFNVIASFDGQFVLNQGTPVTGGCAVNKDASTLEVYDTKTHKLIYSNGCVNGSAVFLKTQNILVFQEKSNIQPLKFYEMPSGKLLYEIKPPKTFSVQFEKIILSEDDRYLTIGEYNESNGVTIKLLIDLTTKQIKSIPVTNPEAINSVDRTSMLQAIGFTKGEKYIVYDVWRTRRIMFYNIDAGRFDDQLTFRYPAGITMFSAMAVSPNGKFLLLGTYSGVIMLLNIEQKKIQGSLYPDAANKDWAVITPQGQFDGNAGAQNNMFHVSGNAVVPLNSMFEKFYTPRLFPRILDGEVFAPSAIDVKILKKAPVVTIQFKEGARNLEVGDDLQAIETKFRTASIAISAECPLDAVTEIRLYQNGKLVETTRNLTVEDDNKGDKKLSKSFQVNLLAGTNRFRAIAFNTERTESRPVELNVVYKLEKDAAAAATIVDGIQLHVVVVGINTYKNPKYNLNYAEADAQAFKLAIENGSTGIFSKVNMHYIKDDKADRAGIVAELEKVKAASKPEDVFIFYYAGHGVVNDKKEFFLVPYDVTQLYGSDEALGQKGLSATNLQQFSKDIKAQKQLYILDACQSAGALDNIVASRGAAEEKAIAQLARSTGTHWLTASGSNQFAAEFTKLGHGAFTYCLLQAFKGITDNGDKKITVKELDAYLQNKVPEITQQYQGAAQYPASYGYGNDFPVIFIK